MKKFVQASLCLCMSLSLHAQQTDSLKSYSLSEVVVSVNKSPDTLGRISQQVLLLDKSWITRQQAQTTADLLAQTTQVYIQKSQAGGGSITLRGFEAVRNLLVIDGIRMNNLIYRSGHLQNIMTTDNQSLERLEVLFGPSSNMYGSDALGGVVHLYTKEARFAEEGKKMLHGNASIRYGSVNNERTSHLDFNIANHKFSWLSSFTFSDFDDLRSGKNQNPFYPTPYGERNFYYQRIDGKDSAVENANRFVQKQTAYSQWDMIQKLAFKQNEHLRHQINFQISNSSNIPRYDRLTDKGTTHPLAFAEWYYGPQSRMMGVYDLHYDNAEAGIQHFHLALAWQDIQESRMTRRFRSNDLQRRVEDVNVLSLYADATRNWKSHTLRAGLDVQYNTLRSTASVLRITDQTILPWSTRYPGGDNVLMNASTYVSHTWAINSQTTLNSGVRAGYSSLSSVFTDTTFFKFPFSEAKQNMPVYSGSVGITHMMEPGAKLSFMVSTGYRVPNVDDLSKVFETAKGRVVVPNPNLRPEKTITYELGITTLGNGKSMWENNLYYTDFIDAIITDVYNYNGSDSITYDGVRSRVFASQNKQRAYIWGFTSNYRYRYNRYLEYSLGATYTYGRVKTTGADVPIDHIPPFMSRMQISYTNNLLKADFYLQFHGWKRIRDFSPVGEDNPQYAQPEGMPAWFTANIRTSVKLYKDIHLTAGVENIFDTQYRTFASGINGPGRNLFVSLRTTF
jgi:hemoglobin/transferrin/lactoferrin receptor protein